MNIVLKMLLTTIIFTLVANAKIPSVVIHTDKKIVKNGKNIKVLLDVKTFKDSKVKIPEIKDIAGYRVKSKKATTKSGKLLDKEILTRYIIYTINPTKSFTINPYKVEIDGKIYKSNSVNVKVLQPVKAKNNGGFIFKMVSDKRDVVVGESIVVDVELIEPIDASSADLRYTAPKFKGFKATPLGDGEIKDKGDSVVRSLKYLLTAKTAGKFTISPARAKIGMQMTPQAQSPFGFFGADIQWKNLSSNSITINVHKKPNGVNLVGNYKIRTYIDKKRVKASKPLTYTLIIEGVGNLSEFEDINIDIPNVTQYKKEPKVEHRFEDGKVYSKYIKKYVFIAKSGYTIPKITIGAYNPNNHKVYTLKTEAMPIHISKAKSITSLLNNNSLDKKIDDTTQKSKENPTKSISSNSTSKVSKVESILFDKEYYKRKYSKDISGSLNIFIALLVGLVLGALGGIFIPKLIKSKRSKKGNKLYGSYKEAMHILYPHIDKDKKIEEMVKFLYEVTNGNKEVVINDKALNKMIKRVQKKKR